MLKINDEESSLEDAKLSSMVNGIDSKIDENYYTEVIKDVRSFYFSDSVNQSFEIPPLLNDTQSKKKHSNYSSYHTKNKLEI